MLFGDAVQAVEHDGQDLVYVLLDQTQNVLVVPEVQRPFRYLHDTEFFSFTFPHGEQSDVATLGTRRQSRGST